MKIGLVASANGLGHIRRLCHLASGLMNLGFEVEILALSKQIMRVKDEFKFDNYPMRFIPIEIYGIEGPAWYANGCRSTQPSKDIVEKIIKYDWVLTDNVIWPFRFSNKVILFGHFTWIDYWLEYRNQIFSPKVDKIFKQEYQLIQKIKTYFNFSDFALQNSIIPKNSQIKTKLMRYETDQFLPRSVKSSNQIWLASGVTGLRDLKDYDFLRNFQYEVFERESFRLVHSNTKPLFIAGRPGLGTIRDCMAVGVPLFPIWNKADPELNSNVLKLKELTLIPFFSSENNIDNLDNLIENMSQSNDLNFSWSEKWMGLSVEVSKICNDILSVVTKMQE